MTYSGLKGTPRPGSFNESEIRAGRLPGRFLTSAMIVPVVDSFRQCGAVSSSRPLFWASLSSRRQPTDLDSLLRAGALELDQEEE
jgi:hypothetical protein